jgi:hypothetical protein
MKLTPEQCHRYGRTIEGVERWLVDNFPDSLLGFADRFLTRSVWADSDAARADLARLREACDLLIDVCQVQAAADELQYDVTAVLALAYGWRRLEIPQLDRLLPLIAPVARAMAPEAATWEEPARSMFNFAVGELGIAPARPRGSPPADPGPAAYLDLHRIMFATAYGRSPAPRSDFRDVLARVDGYFAEPAVRSNPDLCAERMLIESMLSPSDLATCLDYADRLHSLQRPDGGFGKADVDAHNHTVAVAAAALGWLVGTHCRGLDGAKSRPS